MIVPVHVYECEDCIFTFAVEQAWEEQELVSCPVCHCEDTIRDVGPGEMYFKKDS